MPVASAAGIRRAVVTLAVAAVTLSAASAVSAASGSRSRSAPATHKIEPALLAALDGTGHAPTVIEFADSADLSAAGRIKDWTRRGQAVVDSLRATARRSQAAVVDELTTQGVQFQSFWINNTVYLADGTSRLARSAAADPHVKTVRAAGTVPLEKPTPGRAAKAAAGVEWGVADIKADQVWDTQADRGDGIVVANIDSGVQFDHPALVASYRGNRGDGSFEHDYNWWDPSQVCGTPSLAPCDNNGHGTHTMGTMVGDGGTGNRVGVAPGARWIAAKGCESSGCSEFGLTSSAQWVLAPTDLAGENPDPSKRPNIVNNSWGDDAGGNDWYLDFVRAWVAAGMFPAFANGNAGPGCGTSGSPGDYAESYSVGNYAAGGTIAASSSRGGGTTGKAKPDISAPGTNVRSSVPGGKYASFNGTSMATPHVAGTVALMWSRAPALVGDIDATKQLLDDTARDKADSQCGGTADDNFVYGEGELDALAAVTAAPVGDVGTVSGTVTDAGSGQPIPGVHLAFTGTAVRNAVSRADGSYSISLTQGSYHVTASQFGYRTSTSDIEIAGGQTTTHNLELADAPDVPVHGQVRDASGHGWPVYAKVLVEDTPVTTFTDPATGRYTMQLPAGAAYTVDVQPQYPGYTGRSERITVDAATTRNYELAVDTQSCTAPGYRRGAAGLHEDFDRPQAPSGWTVVDHGTGGQVWRFDDPGGHGNRTGGTGRFAVLDSDDYGVHGTQDTSLVSPSVDLSRVAAPTLEFRTDFRHYFYERADVDLSLDGGATWTNVWRKSTDVTGPDLVQVPLPAAAHQAKAQVRFHYLRGNHTWWWQVDDVYLGSSDCEPAPGGLVFGRTTSSVTGKGLADVAVQAGSARPVTSTATPDDARLGDGFYWLFAPRRKGATSLAASRPDYAARDAQVHVLTDGTVRQDLALRSGRITAPHSVAATVQLGQKATVDVALTNSGDVDASYHVTEREPITRVPSPATAGGTAATPLRRIKARTTLLPDVGPGAGRAGVRSHPVPGDWANLPSYPTAIKDSAAGVHDGKLYSFGGNIGIHDPLTASYVYDPGTGKWSSIAGLPMARQRASGAFIDGRYVITGGWGPGDFAPVAETASYDPDTDSWSIGAPNPVPLAAAGTGVVDGKLYVVGGCETETCGHTDVLRYDPRTEAWTRLADFPYAVAWSSCGGINGVLYCAGGSGPEADGIATWAYTPATDSWRQVADMPEDVDGGAYAVVGDELVIAGGAVNRGSMLTNATYAYDPASDTWRTLPNSRGTLYRGAGACGFYKIGGFDGERADYSVVEQLPGLDDCAAPTDYAWLSFDKATGTVRPGKRQVVRVRLDASRVTRPGTYVASLRVGEGTPYPVRPITVRLVVKPRR